MVVSSFLFEFLPRGPAKKRIQVALMNSFFEFVAKKNTKDFHLSSEDLPYKLFHPLQDSHGLPQNSAEKLGMFIFKFRLGSLRKYL